MRDYEIWHDEYREDDSVDEYWHGIFFTREPVCNQFPKFRKHKKPFYSLKQKERIANPFLRNKHLTFK